jgi:hypothetical protein
MVGWLITNELERIVREYSEAELETIPKNSWADCGGKESNLEPSE